MNESKNEEFKGRIQMMNDSQNGWSIGWRVKGWMNRRKTDMHEGEGEGWSKLRMTDSKDEELLGGTMSRMMYAKDDRAAG